MPSAGPCPICLQTATSEPSKGLLAFWSCPVCGHFKADLTDQVMWERYIQSGMGYKLSAAVRMFNRSKTAPIVEVEFVEKVIKEPDKTLWEKSRFVLELIESRTTFFGETVKVTPGVDYPLTHSKHAAELFSLLTMHRDEKNTVWDSASPSLVNVTLTAKGVESLEEMRRTKPDAETAFVAMWFNDDMNRIYDTQISKGIEDAGYRPVRIDLVPHNGDVVGRIMAEIRIAKFVVADFTGHRGGVYFEAGFAKGLGMEVIWLCRDDHFEESHFDVNHFNHIVWKDDGTLRDHLATRILATASLGPGPFYKSPSTN